MSPSPQEPAIETQDPAAPRSHSIQATTDFLLDFVSELRELFASGMRELEDLFLRFRIQTRLDGVSEGSASHLRAKLRYDLALHGGARPQGEDTPLSLVA